MTRASLREYAAQQHERYRSATRAEKRRLLDEVVAVTGMHRKAAIRLLRRAPRPPRTRWRGGRPVCYGPEVASTAEVLWQAAGRIGAHHLHPFVPELLDRLTRCGDLTLAPAVDKLVRQASRPTLARLLTSARAQYPLRGAATTHPSTWLKQQIPIRTFTDWDDARPGFLEVDLVAHCGSSTQGFYLCTLCAVDIASCWIELQAVWGKGQRRVGGATLHFYARLPMPLLGPDSDNGSEFINHALYDWCQRHAVALTRGRSWQKNDSAHVEQRGRCAAKIKDFRLHDTRHTFASRLAMEGVDLLTIKELGGWKTLSMVQRYAHLSPGHQRQAIERLVTRTVAVPRPAEATGRE